MSQPYSAPLREAPAAIPAAIDDTPRIRRGQRVWCGNHHVGLVNLLRAPSEGRARSFVLRRGVLRHRDVIVPMTWVADVDERRVLLTAARRDLDTLPAYHDDHLLADAIGRALSADPRLRALGDDGIGVTVEDGNVELRGHVSGSDNTFRVGQAAQAIPGVLRVTNHVVDDGALAMAVARALGTHAATRAQRIHVHARHGVIYLEGDTADVEVRAAAQACAASTPHVRGIVNSIHAPGETIQADAQRVLQPQIGQQIYAPGLRLGTVEQVIISPLRCAVVAMVARGCFAGSAQRDDTRSDLPPLLERRVVIPTAAVRAVTQSAVLLRISGDEAADCDAFEPARFVAPAPGWEPPFPYQRGDVLFVRAPAHEIAAPAHPA